MNYVFLVCGMCEANTLFICRYTRAFRHVYYVKIMLQPIIGTIFIAIAIFCGLEVILSVAFNLMSMRNEFAGRIHNVTCTQFNAFKDTGFKEIMIKFNQTHAHN